MSDRTRLQAGQKGLGDMTPDDFRKAAHVVADMVADYLENLEEYPVLPVVEPGEIRASQGPRAPATPEPLEDILADYLQLIEPRITHWQHPGFMAYFSSIAFR